MKSRTDDTETPLEENTIVEDQIVAESSEETKTNNHINAQAKRGRMITASLVVTIVLTCIAVTVVGVFELTGRFLRVCPKELPVNDPAPILWNDMTSEKSVQATLGVSQRLKEETALKSSVMGSN